MASRLQQLHAIWTLLSAAATRQRDQWRTPDELHILREQRLGRLLRVAARAPYYEQLFARHRIDLDGNPVAALQAIPLLDRATLKREPLTAFATAPLTSMFEMKTSGSSGTPMAVYRLPTDEAHISASWFRVYRAYGCTPGSSEVNIGRPTVNPKRGPVRVLRNLGVLPQIHTASSLMPIGDLARLVAQHQPAVVNGYAATMQALAQYLLEHPILRTPPRFVGCGAMEVSRECIETVARAFQAPVANVYVTNDAGVIAWSCPENSHVLHNNDDVYHVEILRADGTPTDPGETGELVVTPLLIFGMPLLRYRLGDLAARLPDQCRCGRGLGLLTPVQGRTSHVIRTPSGQMLTSASAALVFSRADARHWAARFQFRETGPGELDVLVQPRRPPTAGELTAIAHAINEFFGNDFQFRIQIVPDLPLAANGKFQSVVPRVMDLAGEMIVT